MRFMVVPQPAQFHERMSMVMICAEPTVYLQPSAAIAVIVLVFCFLNAADLSGRQPRPPPRPICSRLPPALTSCVRCVALAKIRLILIESPLGTSVHLFYRYNTRVVVFLFSFQFAT